MSLSRRLALLTVLFIFLIGLIIFVPAVSIFRSLRMEARVSDAALVAEALISSPNPELNVEQSTSLLEGAQVLDMIIFRDGRQERLLIPAQTHEITERVNLIETNWFVQIPSSLACFFGGDHDVMLVTGNPNDEVDRLQVVIDELPLCQETRRFALGLLLGALFVSLAAGALLFLSARRILVRPILFLTRAITGFQGDRDSARLVEERSKITEIRAAEGSLREMQERILTSMEQKTRLANLGESVAKIQHDLRNMLSTAQMVADNLENSEDPKVRRVAPRLMRSLDRAIELSSQTLAYGRVGERAAKMESVALAPILEEIVEEEAMLNRADNVTINLECAEDVTAIADHEFLRRIVQNLVRNARQILEEGAGGTVEISAFMDGSETYIAVEDNGPGMSESARENIFTPFRGSTRIGGTGLGLPICHELTAMMGGRLELVHSDQNGTCFELVLRNSGESGFAGV